MTGKLRHLWRHHPIALTLFGAATVLALVFVVRLAVFSLYWANPAHRQQLPEPWMTPGYVAFSWHMQIERVFHHLGLPDHPKKRLTLDQIAEARGQPVEALIADLTVFLQTQADAE